MWFLLNLILILYLTCEQCQGVIRLEELRESYLEAYQKRQYISPNFTKGAPNVNVRKFDLIWHRCQEPSQFSSEQIQRLIKYHGEEFILNAIIENLLRQPRGRIFSGDNYDTKSEDYHIALAGSGGCFYLKERKPLNLVKTWGTCIRAFNFPNCFGMTLAIYPGSRVPQNTPKLKELTEIKSIGPCLPDEFLSSSLKPGKEMEVMKNVQFKDHNPDLIDLPQNSIEYSAERSDTSVYPGSTYSAYVLGPKNRMENILVTIEKKNIDESQATKMWMPYEKFQGNEAEEGDVLCYIIPPKFQGPTDESWNGFLGTKSAAENWGNVSSNISVQANGLERLKLVLSFIYEDENGIRPLFIYYYAWANGFISYGRVLNGHHDNLKSSQITDHTNGTNFQINKEVEREYKVENAWIKSHDRLEKFWRGMKMSRNGNSAIQNINHVKNQVWDCTVKAQQFFSTFQENFLKNHSEKMKAQSSAIERMVRFPMARFYSGVNYTGDHEDFVLNGAVDTLGVCYDLNELKMQVESIATFGTCIRIFTDTYCWRESLVIYPDSKKNSSLSQILLEFDLTDIESVGPCLLGEMTQSYFAPDGKFVPQTIFPRFITFHYWGRFKDPQYVEHGSVFLHQIGPQNRTELIYAEIEPEKYMDIISMENFRRYKSPVCFKNQKDKRLCYAVPPMLNGPKDQPYNIFEASQDAVQDWSDIFWDFSLEKHRNYRFAVNFQYDNVNSTRPTWIFYYIFHAGQGIYYGQV